MSEHINPFDQTIWDPINPEQAIEDPMHGPSATFDLASIPPMPNGNGLYRRFGDFPHGTGYENSLGQPVLVVRSGHSFLQMQHEITTEQEWIAAAQQGDEATLCLEAERQRIRLEERGYVHAFRQTDFCAGGQTIAECDTASDMMQRAAEYSNNNDSGRVEDSAWTTLAWLSKKCGSCVLSCSIAVKPNGETRFTNSKPFNGPTFSVEEWEV